MRCTTVYVVPPPPPPPETGEITIKVVAQITAEPIPNVNVEIDGYTGVTGGDGTVVITAPVGRYMMELKHEDYLPKRVPVSVPNDYAFVMKPR